MSDTLVESAAPPEVAPADGPEWQKKKEDALRVTGEILEKMGLGCRLDSKDVADGGIAIALHLEAQVPGVVSGRRSHLLESLQFIVNKMVNKPGSLRRWVSMGVGAFPEPRAPRPVGQPPPAAVAAPAPIPVARPERAPRQAPAASPPKSSPRAAPVTEEAELQVSEDAELSRAARVMAERSAQLGRHYAIASMTADNRKRVLLAAAGVAGVQVRAEGEGRNRRVVFVPAKPVPMPRRAVLDYGDDSED